MLNKIIRFSVGNKLIIALGVAALLIAGGLQLTKLPIDAVPDITDNQVQVITVSPSLGAPDVERLITFPVEHANANIPGLKEIRSFSRFGLSVVTIVFHDDVDVYWARQQVSERLQLVRTQIPPGAGNPELAPVTTGLGEIYQYMVRAKPGYEKRYSLMDLRTIQDWQVRRQLLGTEGVADVSSFGGELKQYEIAVDPARLTAADISISDIFTAVERNNQNGGGSYIEKGPNVYFIRTEGLFKDPADIGAVVVRQQSGGLPLLLRDVAEVKTGRANRFGAMLYNDRGEVAGAVVMMLKGANSSAVISRVKEKIAAIQKTLPEGVVIEPFLDRTKMVDNAIGTVSKNLMEGALIVVLVLVLFLGNLRAGLIVASVIPLSMLFAIIMMNIFGVSGNLMSLGALDFGLIVDGAVIIVEAVLHRLFLMRAGIGGVLDKKDMDNVVGDSASKMMNAAVFGQIIILVVYLPILTLQGIEGKMFRPMAQTVSFALLGAFILSLTYVPALSAMLLRKSAGDKANLAERVFHRIEAVYRRWLGLALQKSRVILLSVLLLFSGAMVLLLNMGGEFIPELEEGDFAIETRLLTGSNLHSTIDACTRASGILKASFPEVEKVVAKIGSAEIPTDPMPMEAADLMVILKDKKHWTSAESFDELAEKMQQKLKPVPGVSFGFQYPVQMRFNELMTGAKQDVVCKIFGEDLDSLPVLAARLGQLIHEVEGAEDIYVEATGGMPQVVVQYDRMAMARYGVDVSTVNSIIQAAYAGAEAGQVFENERRFDLVIRMPGTDLRDPEQLGNLPVRLPGGATVPLSALAKVDVVDGPNQIQRQDARRRIVVGFNVRGRDVESIVKELQDKVNQRLRLPAGYTISYGGSFQNLQEASARLAVAVPVALVLILVMLYFAFGSLSRSALVFSAIPLSAIGGVFGLWLRDMPFSISAGVGFIALFGVAVLNGIVLITEFNALKEHGVHDVDERISTGAARRLRPVLMTAAVASLGFLPMAVSNGSGAEVQRPLATVVIAGIISATILTLFVLPMLYHLSETKSWKSLITGRKKAATLPLLLVLLAASSASAQSPPYTLKSALDRAVGVNGALQAAAWNNAAARSGVRASVALPMASAGLEYGHVNSYYTDNRILVSQEFRLPGWYKARKEAARALVRMSEADSAARDAELRLEVKRAFYGCLSLQEKARVIRSSDSLWKMLEDRMNARFRAGDISAVELNSVRMQRLDLAARLQTTEVEAAACRSKLAFLLQDSSVFQLSAAGLQYEGDPALLQSADLSHNTALLQAQSRAGALQGNWQAERKNLLPVVSLGYSNMSIVGWQRVGNDDRYFGNGDRFGTGSLSLQAPLFVGPYRSRIKAAEQEWLGAGVDAAYTAQSVKNAVDLARLDLQRNIDLLNTRRGQITLYADSMLSLARLQLDKGEISYVEWMLLTGPAFDYLQQWPAWVSETNEAWFRLEYLLNQP